MLRSAMSSVRDHLRLIYDTSVAAVKPNSLIKNFIQFNGNQLLVKHFSGSVDKKISIQDRDIYILGAGKAVLKMCEEFLNQFEALAATGSNGNCKIREGLLSVPMGATTDSPLFGKYNVKFRSGALHNMPDDNSRDTTQQIVDLVRRIKPSPTSNNIPLIISFISGGGSALLTLPKAGLSVAQKCEVISQLVKSGATIAQLNAVRQCLSQVKAGKLAGLAIKGPDSVQIVSFLISDIINDPIGLIASGPTVVQETDSIKPSEKAFQILKDLNVNVTDDVKHLILSEDKWLEGDNPLNTSLVDNIVIGNNSLALKTAEETAHQLGYKVIFLGNDIKGEASRVATGWAHLALNYEATEDEVSKYKGICWLAGGETTVNMIGMGGRCQEMGLAFYRALSDKSCPQKLYLMCAGTDGQDGPTDAAGVVVENIDPKVESKDVLRELVSDLKNHNSYHFFANHCNSWLIRSGITGTNVMDIYCMIKLF